MQQSAFRRVIVEPPEPTVAKNSGVAAPLAKPSLFDRMRMFGSMLDMELEKSKMSSSPKKAETRTFTPIGFFELTPSPTVLENSPGDSPEFQWPGAT